MKVYILSFFLLVGIVFERCQISGKKDLKKTEEMQTIVFQNDTLSDAIEWETFNMEAQIAIKESEIQIEGIRDEISEIRKEEQKKLYKVLEALAQKNKELKLRLNEINATLKANMEQSTAGQEIIKVTFEKAFVQDMNELLWNLETFWKNKH